MAAILTIGGNVLTMIEDTLDMTFTLNERQRLQGDVIDYTGTLHFSKGESVVLTDPSLGIIFNGVLNTDQEYPVYPVGAIRHTIDCIDYGQYIAGKRTYTRDYTDTFPAGKLVIDQLDDILIDEGINQNFALHTDTLATDFNEGVLSGTAGYVNTNSEDLELAKAGSDLVIDEVTTAQFSTGTLNNMQTSGNILYPITVNALKLQTTLSFAYGIEFAQEQQVATGTASGTATGSFSAGVSSSGNFSTNVNSSGNFSTNVNSSGSLSTGVSTSGSFTPSGSVSLSGGPGGESVSFFGSGGTVNTSGSIFATINSTGTASATVNSSGTAAATVNSTGTASGTVNSPFSTTVNSSVTKTYQPKTKSKVKVADTHYEVITVDKAVADNRIDAMIWTGSYTIGSNDTLNYDIWISSTSPSQEGGIDLYFSDGTTMTEYLGSLDNNNDTGLWDQNLVSISPIQDLSDYAKDCWYTRQISLSPLSGKIITGVTIFNAANIAGTFDIYIKNCYLGSHSGSPFFSLSQTVPSLNPVPISSIGSYIIAATLVNVVAVYLPTTSYRISPAYNIDPVKLVKSSLITWSALNPTIGPLVVPDSPGAAKNAGTETIFVSYDGTTWLPCVNNQPVPGLPAGANVSGGSLYILETFSGGQDPSAIPGLLELTITINSAPRASTTDVVNYFGSTTAWNTGTEEGTAPNSNGDLVLGQTSYSWSNLNGVTFVAGDLTDPDVVVPTVSVSSGALVVTSTGDSDGATWSSTRFNFISAAQNFTIEADFTLNGFSSPIQNEMGFLYRQTYWGSPNNSFAYYVRLMQNPGGTAGGTSVTLGYGINSPPSQSNTGQFTLLQQVGVTISNNTTYHIKVLVSQNRHTIYWNHSSTPLIDLLDNTYTQPGNIGVRTYVFMGNAVNNPVNKISNFSITNTFAGIWTSPYMYLGGLGTCGNTQISWSEVNTTGSPQASAIVIASIDGGNTWQQCTNGAVNPNSSIPYLAPGTNVSSYSLLIQVILSSTGFLSSPIIMGLCVRVCGAYPGSSGTRTTAPLGIDYVVRANQSGFGTSSDGQTWVKAGTGTDTVSSDELTIANTTGDVHERLGTRTSTDEDVTIRFQLSASTMTGGVELRYSDANNFYRLSASTSAISIIKKQSGGTINLKTISSTLSTGTWYRMRFRVTGQGAGNIGLFGEIWPDLTLEPLVVNSNAWTITTSE